MRKIKKVLKYLAVRTRSVLISHFYPGKNLIFIHIGKCGGTSVSKALRTSAVVAKKYSHVETVHKSKPPVLRGSSYLVVVRNPISRAISAFNWRYHRIVETKVQSGLPGEFDILAKYQNLNRLAEKLYQEESLNLVVAREFLSIRHLRESIAFYLEELLPKIRANQVFGVLVTEYLSDDIKTFLGGEDSHENQHKASNQHLFLSDLAKKNLAKFLELEFKLLDKLGEVATLPAEKRRVLLIGRMQPNT